MKLQMVYKNVLRGIKITNAPPKGNKLNHPEASALTYSFTTMPGSKHKVQTPTNFTI